MAAALHLLVGLPAAGKTTAAKRLATQHGLLRLTPDDWMLPLFGDPDAGGKRDILEGRLLTIALDSLRLGTGVVLDFGCWSRPEREAIRWLAERENATYHLVYLPVARGTQLARIEQRQRERPRDTWPVTVEDLDGWRRDFEEPGPDELAGRPVAAPVGGWPAWAMARWPSLEAD